MWLPCGSRHSQEEEKTRLTQRVKVLQRSKLQNRVFDSLVSATRVNSSEMGLTWICKHGLGKFSNFSHFLSWIKDLMAKKKEELHRDKILNCLLGKYFSDTDLCTLTALSVCLELLINPEYSTFASCIKLNHTDK